MRSGKIHKLDVLRYAVGVILVVGLVVITGCSRGFYRRQVDKDVAAILEEKDQFAAWKIEQYHVHPDPRSRFADPTNPDRPPMPPDDPAAKELAPNPQRVPKEGVAWIEGDGYLNLLAFWDAQNKGERCLDEVARRFTDIRPSEVLRAAAWQKEDGKIGDDPYGTRNALLPRMDPGFLLKIHQAVELGLINSREFQARREDLYLAALPVSLERFAFKTQFFAFEEAIRQRSGRESQSGYGNFWEFNSTLGFSRLFSTGALLLASFANQTVINLTGADRHTISTSILNLDLIQPLLRGGGRAVTLEPLTQVERNLLYEIRSYARFRKEFFQYITGGTQFRPIQSLGDGVAIRGIGLSPGALSLGTGNPAAPQIRPGGVGSLDLGASFRTSGPGYLPTVLVSAFLKNEVKNVQKLNEILVYFKALVEGGDVSALQVEQVELEILRATTTVYQRDKDLRDALDLFKLQLGLPMTVPLDLDDVPLLPVAKQLERFEDVINTVEPVIKKVSQVLDDKEDAKNIRKKLRKLLDEEAYINKAPLFSKMMPSALDELEKLSTKDFFARHNANLERKLNLLKVVEGYLKLDEEEKKKTPRPVDQERELEQVEREIILGKFELGIRQFALMPWTLEKREKEIEAAYATAYRNLKNAFTLLLDEATAERLRLVEESWPVLPPLVVEGVDLVAGDLEAAYSVATRAALENRLDLMNARARVVDTWRQVALFANSLLGTFNVGYHVDSITPPGQAKPLAFSGSRTRQQLFFSAELPLVRLAERNAYRASLIAFQRARRDLMALEDLVVAQVREELRQLRFLAKTFEIQQQSMELAYRQVENSLEQFRAPPAAPGGGGGTAGNQAALTQQLLNAQRSLPQTQNQLFSTWVSFHVFRQQLFLDLELMPLDYRGVWSDEYSFCPPHIHVEPGLEWGPGISRPHGGDLPGSHPDPLVPAGVVPAAVVPAVVPAGGPARLDFPIGATPAREPEPERHRARLLPPL